ncbi:MAG TPA: RNA 3'-terminal phosphate cyclase [Gallionella sp.]|nr:RNA 3'-terminal phosphate cyclase [Gallionella sp.]
MEMIILDGSHGEGGGQILRSALSLSMITGVPFRIDRIRANRPKPGLLRQHLTAVNAATAICGAEVSGNVLGSESLVFHPGAIKGGDYRFSIGTAGSCTLVLQTLLPALWFADRPSVVTVSGGTHNAGAPPADFLVRAWLPLMRRMGVKMDVALLRHGFYPAGGGEVRAEVQPIEKLLPLALSSRGKLLSTKMIAVVAGLPPEIGQRELDRLNTYSAFGLAEKELRVLDAREGPGNAVMIELCHEQLTEIFTAFGEKRVSAEVVASRVAQEALTYLECEAVAGEHLADQLVLPMALAGGGVFTTTALSSHLQTNVQIVRKFLPVEFEVAKTENVHTISAKSIRGGTATEGFPRQFVE